MAFSPMTKFSVILSCALLSKKGTNQFMNNFAKYSGRWRHRQPQYGQRFIYEFHLNVNKKLKYRSNGIVQPYKVGFFLTKSNRKLFQKEVCYKLEKFGFSQN